jgi:hypothetical protein
LTAPVFCCRDGFNGRRFLRRWCRLGRDVGHCREGRLTRPLALG